jgi:phospholipid/cholesterol/gamma-HCH transport system substrate-binding protein
MASQRTKFTVGLFVASGIGLAVVAIIWLGMSRFLEKGQNYSTYFNESVQGLDIDSPVKYRGVTIGRVGKIAVASDSKLIEVVLKIESGQTLDSDMVAQLKAVGITGSVFIELDRRRKGEADRSPLLSFTSQYPVVASRPSEISVLLRGIDDVIQQIKSLDLEAISEKTKLALDKVNQKATEADVAGISLEIESSLKRVNHILDKHKWDNIIASIDMAAQSLRSLMERADQGLRGLEDTLNQVQGIIADKQEVIKRTIEDFGETGKNAKIFLQKGTALVTKTDDTISQLNRRFLAVIQNLEKAGENISQLTELLAEQPSQLLFGGAPQPRKLKPGPQEKK